VFRYRYELVGRPVEYEGCHLASLKDIAAMKMTAIVQRATKRDYADLYAIFKNGSVDLGDAVSTMKSKFPGVDPSLALRALGYFEDGDKQPMPEMLVNMSWNDVKAGLLHVRSRGIDRGGPSQ
jgi:hypothetical protein